MLSLENAEIVYDRTFGLIFIFKLQVRLQPHIVSVPTVWPGLSQLRRHQGKSRYNQISFGLLSSARFHLHGSFLEMAYPASVRSTVAGSKSSGRAHT